MIMLLQFIKLFTETLTTSDYWYMSFIQFFLLVLFLSMVIYVCRLVKKKDPGKSVKKTCILVWFLSAIAWFIIAQIVWIITSIQLSGS